MKFVKNKSKELGEPKAPAAPRARKRKASAGGSTKKSSGKEKFILLVGDEGSILVYMQGVTVVRRLFAVSPQPDHTSAMLELLQKHPSVPVYVLADVMDQQYVRHSFPPVSALSVSNLVKRRIERDFQAGDLTGFVRLGREKTGRKEWQYLLIALANTPLIQQWLDLVVEQPNELKGIYLTPVEGQRYIPALHAALTSERPLPWQLLVSHHKVSGFRQIVLKGGKLVFTRVTQAIDDAVPAVIAGNIEQEIMNTLEYIRRLGFNENNSMEMIVIAAQEVKEALDIRRFNAGQAWVMTPLDVADSFGFEQAALSADRFGDVVMAASFARTKSHHLKLLSAYGAKLSQIYAARRGVKIVGTLLALVLLGLCGLNITHMLQARSQMTESADQRRPVQAQMASVRQALSGLNRDVAFKSSIMLTYDAYMKDMHQPAEFISTLSPLLLPQTRIRKFSWGLPSVLNAGSGSGTPSATPAGVLEMQTEMEITGTFEDTRALAKFVEAYVAQLKVAMPQYEITNVPYPWQNKVEANVEISFDQQAEASKAIEEGENRITLIFSGPKDPAMNTAPTSAEGMMP